MSKFNYHLSRNISISNFTTEDLFDSEFIQSEKSAIDDFIDKRAALFILVCPYEDKIDQLPNELSNMIFLGFISAVESYVRKIIRSIINVDHCSRVKCENQVIKFGAVLSHQEKTMLPESLLEEYSFASGRNIKDTIDKLLDIKCRKETQPLNKALEEYSRVCQLRHCVIHRFGFLGSNNAINLGLSEHKQFIEKPLRINFDQLNEIARVCENVVKVVNNFLFSEILERTYKNRTEKWFSDFRRDKKTFLKYYSIFKDSSNKEKIINIYKEFMNEMHKEFGKGY